MSASRFTESLLAKILDPGLCPGCHCSLETAELFCPACTSRLRHFVNPCRLCGLENRSDGEICAVCLYDPPRWQTMVAPLQYRGLVRELLLKLKFSESLFLANTMVNYLIDDFGRGDPLPEILLPVPLHKNRLMDRGYNQAYEIARILSSRLGIGIDRQTLNRNRDTEFQTGLSATRREKNTLKAFSCQPNHYQHVAVVDDIITTGSTANEITKTLHRSGIEVVEIWSLARVLNPD